MRKVYLYLAALLFIGIALPAQTDIKGKWKVNCALEKTDKGSMHVCDICPSVMLANNTAVINDFEWTITDESITFRFDAKELEVAYKWDSGTNTLEFKYNDKDYKFRVLILSDPNINILKTESGEILYLKKLH